MNKVMWRGISTGMEWVLVKVFIQYRDIYGGIEIRWSGTGTKGKQV